MVHGYKYSEIPASTSLDYIEHLSYSAFSIVATEGLLLNCIRPSSPITAIGQIMPLVIAIVTAIRALWVFVFMCCKGRSRESRAARKRGWILL
jgi:hypothetical protein